MPILTVKIPSGRLGNFLAGAAVASVISGTAIAITSSNFTYSEVHTGFFSINAMAMAPADFTSANTFAADVNRAYANQGGAVCFNTGVNLPQGAKIISVLTWYKSDGSFSDNNIQIFLFRQNLSNDATNALVQATIPDDSNTRRSTGLTVPANLGTVDNQTFSYGYGVCMQNGGTDFRGARIKYEYQKAGD